MDLRADKDYDTFTGMVFDFLGAVPGDGEEKIRLELPQMTVEIRKI